MPSIGCTPGCPLAAEDIRNLKHRPRHRGWRLGWRAAPLLNQRKPVEWAHHLADRACGDAGVERCRVELRMAGKYLNDADIDILLQEMSRKAVPQRVHGNTLVNLCQLGRRMADAVQL